MKPAALEWSIDNCGISRAMAILGERWTIVVLREIFSGVRRFDDLRDHTDIPRQVLTNRLQSLVSQGILRREPYQEPGSRQRHEYRLTEKGFALYPVLVAVLEWGDRYLSDADGSPFRIAHRDCDSTVHVRVSCADGHEVAKPRDLVFQPTPAARRRVSPG